MKILAVVSVILTFALASRSVAGTGGERADQAAEVQKLIASLSTTPVIKYGSVKDMLLHFYSNNEEARAAVERTPGNQLEETMGMDSRDARKEIVIWYFKQYKIPMAANDLPYEPAHCADFLAKINAHATMRELLDDVLSPEHVWRVDYERYSKPYLHFVDNPLYQMSGAEFLPPNDNTAAELRALFIKFETTKVKGDAEGRASMTDDRVFPVGAGTFGYWIKHSEIKQLCEKEFARQPYSVFTLEQFMHAGLVRVAKVHTLPAKPWKGMQINWSTFGDGDYFVAAPSTIGWLGGESLGNGELEYAVFRKVKGVWKVVGM